MQLMLTQSSFYRNLDPTNQMELLAIVTNKQSSLDDMMKEIDEWYQKQPPQIQTAAKLYSQNLSQAINEMNAHSQQMQANLSPAAKAFLQQEDDEKDSNETPVEDSDEYDQRFQALPPNVQQELKQYDTEELQFVQQTLNKDLSNRSKRYIHF
uniref:Uncharacterized protein n=1 Tax=Acrobeloides nanus TaxID=290746 RepID=A0A914EFN1_9BILA